MIMPNMLARQWQILFGELDEFAIFVTVYMIYSLWLKYVEIFL